MKYPGGKNGSGVYQRLISMMPPHDTYIELFLGSGAVMRRKRPAARSIAYELNLRTIAEFDNHLPGDKWPVGVDEIRDNYDRRYCNPDNGDELTIRQANAIDALRTIYAADSMFWLTNDPARTLIYADPPYLQTVRKSQAAIYEFEMLERSQHVELLDLLAAVPCRVMVSGYASALYARKLKAWRTEQIPTVNRAGQKVTEFVWLNFPEPFELHDYQYVGENFRDRWRIEKRARRWVKNLAAMPPAERYAILGRLNDLRAALAAAERQADTEAAEQRKRVARRRNRQNRNASVTPAAALPAVGQEQSLF